MNCVEGAGFFVFSIILTPCLFGPENDILYLRFWLPGWRLRRDALLGLGTGMMCRQ